VPSQAQLEPQVHACDKSGDPQVQAQGKEQEDAQLIQQKQNRI